MSEEFKKSAAMEALAEVEPNMKLGLGTGSTANYFIEALGEKVSNGLEIECVPTSERSAELASSLGIPLISLEDSPQLDLTVDGADELNGSLELIKGGGGALLREKIVASASRKMVVIADESKHVDVLGRFPLPIEVVQFGLSSTIFELKRKLRKLNLKDEVSIRRVGQEGFFVTDNGNFIVDASLERIEDPAALESELKELPGVVECGLFVGIADTAYVAGQSGVAKVCFDGSR